MAENVSKRRKNSSDSVASVLAVMGKSVKEKKLKRPKERWLLTRKTWRYMTDAGRKLIPDGTHNRPEDIPKIEAYFQEVCQKEPRFLLWRKSSYPGALGFRSHRKRRDRRKGGSCRKASSADEAEDIKPKRPKDLPLPSISGGRFDINKLKYDFLNKPPSPTTSTTTSSPRSFLRNKETFPVGSSFASVSSVPSFPEIAETQDSEEKVLVDMLEQYLSLSEQTNQPSTSAASAQSNLDYQTLIDKLQRHLTLVSQQYPQYTDVPYQRRDNVAFEGDHVQKSLSETLNRYFSRSPNRDKVVSDMLTDRKLLQKLYFDLRRTKGFGSNRSGTVYGSSKAAGNQWRSSLYSRSHSGLFYADERDENAEGSIWKHLGQPLARHRDGSLQSPPPLIEIHGESQEQTFQDWGVQTDTVPEHVLVQADVEYKKLLAEKEEEMKDNRPGYRRRSSVDNDDVSQSVSDTIKRYLRMARKKSVDSDKADRFKRVNYDRNLRNIKAKGEITKPGDDDGLNKGCQTNDDWIVTFKESPKFDESSDHEISQGSRLTSSRSSFDAAGFEELQHQQMLQQQQQQQQQVKSSPTSPTGFLSSSQSFLSHLLHGKHSHHDKSSVAAGTMQKSKSSSSVIHHGSRLMAKKIFRSRSKSQTRPAATVPSLWTPQGGCTWTCVTGRQVVLTDTSLCHLSEVERKTLQKVALAKLEALNLGTSVKIPIDIGGSSSQQKPKRRAYLLKRKALTTGFFDTGRKDKDGNAVGGLVFGIPLTQCVENDRLARAASGTGSFRSGDLSATSDEHSLGRHGSRASFSSLIDTPRCEDSGSCESLMSRERIIGSVPGLLNTLAYDSQDILTTPEEEPAVPNIVSSCIKFLENHGMHVLGIFRVSTSKKRVRQLREDFDSGKETVLDEEQCPHDIATLLKEYFRDLPDPLLCKELYHAFIATQKVRNRKLQIECLQHLIQILPMSNRDTLWSLLGFLANVASNAVDRRTETGSVVEGNKMDSNNLATVFAPNILHNLKAGSSNVSDNAGDRLDVINVVRTLIDHHEELFQVSSQLLDEIYIHIMDTNPDALDQLLNKKDNQQCLEESLDDLDSESSSAPWSPTSHSTDIGMEQLLLGVVQGDADGRNTPPEPKRTWSREEFLHETAAMGGPNVAMRIRSKDRDRMRDRTSKKRWKDDLNVKKKADESSSNSSNVSSSATAGTTKSTIFTRMRSGGSATVGHGKEDEYITIRSSSIDSNSSVQTEGGHERILRTGAGDDLGRRQSSPYVLGGNSGVITASLTIPVQSQQPLSLNVDDSDIPFIEDGSFAYAADGGRQQMTIGLVKTTTGPSAPPRRRQRSMSGSDSSQSSTMQAVTGSISFVQQQQHQQGYDSAMGSSATFSPPHYNTPSSVGSSIADPSMYSSPPSWASTPPTSPDSTHTSVNYIPDDIRPPAKITLAGKQITTATLVAQRVASGILSKESVSPTLQRVSFSSTSELQQVRAPVRHAPQCWDTMPATTELPKCASTPSVVQRPEHSIPRVEPKLSTGISNIGGAVLRSKTADFERLMKTTKSVDVKSKASTAATVVSPSSSSTLSEKKKYTKRRYTDSRHQTRHIPDSDTLDSSASTVSREKTDVSRINAMNVSNITQPGPVYKRRELIASVPKDRKSLV